MSYKDFLSARARGSLNRPDGNVTSSLGRLLGNTFRGQGPDNGASSGGVVAPRPFVEIASPASRVSVPMPTSPQGVSGELGDWSLPGYLSPQEHIAQVPLEGFRQPAGGMKTSDIAVVSPVSIAYPDLYTPSGRSVPRR